MNSLSILKQKFNGDVFIFASGKSAQNFPVSKYVDKKFICVNGSVRFFIDNNIKPFAYIFNDEGFLKSSLDLVLSAIKVSSYIFMPRELYVKFVEGYLSDSKLKEKVFFIERVGRPYKGLIVSDKIFYFKNILNKDYVYSFSLLSNRKNRIGFSRNIESGYFCARTIPYVAIQLAYYLGFNNVFMIGLDLSSNVGRFYDKENPLPTTLDKDYDRYIYPSFELAAKRVFNKSFMVYNLSLDSKLPETIIPKITLNDLSRIINEK